MVMSNTMNPLSKEKMCYMVIMKGLKDALVKQGNPVEVIEALPDDHIFCLCRMCSDTCVYCDRNVGPEASCEECDCWR